jgi:hypothetical protein
MEELTLPLPPPPPASRGLRERISPAMIAHPVFHGPDPLCSYAHVI